MAEAQENHSVLQADEEDDDPQLSSSALAALNEFLAEKNEREERLRQIAESTGNGKLLEDVELEEDWVCLLFLVVSSILKLYDNSSN